MHEFEFLIPITMFLAVALVLFKFFDDRHRERMAIIDKGLVKEEVKYLYARGRSSTINPFSSLKWGMLAAFIGAGILTGSLLSVTFPWIEEGPLMSGCIFLFGGIGLMLFYSIASHKLQAEDSK
jgi:hypothetical protein